MCNRCSRYSQYFISPRTKKLNTPVNMNVTSVNAPRPTQNTNLNHISKRMNANTRPLTPPMDQVTQNMYNGINTHLLTNYQITIQAFTSHLYHDGSMTFKNKVDMQDAGLKAEIQTRYNTWKRGQSQEDLAHYANWAWKY